MSFPDKHRNRCVYDEPACEGSLERATAKINRRPWGLSPVIHVEPATATDRDVRRARSTALILGGLLEDVLAHSCPSIGWIVYVELGSSASVRVELTHDTEAEANRALGMLEHVLKAARNSALNEVLGTSHFESFG